MTQQNSDGQSVPAQQKQPGQHVSGTFSQQPTERYAQPLNDQYVQHPYPNQQQHQVPNQQAYQGRQQYPQQPYQQYPNQQQPTVIIQNNVGHNYGGGPQGFYERPLVEKNWIVALVLSIVLGALGIDRMYLGHVGLGIVKLITAGGAGIWWIIDIILIATKNVKGIRWI